MFALSTIFTGCMNVEHDNASQRCAAFSLRKEELWITQDTKKPKLIIVSPKYHNFDEHVHFI